MGKKFQNTHNLKADKKILFLAIGVILIGSLISINSVLAAENTYPVTVGQNTLQYRDITNLEPTPEPVTSFDKHAYYNLEPVIVTVQDFNADLDVTVVDFTSAVIVSPSGSTSTLSLTETDSNSGEFVGSFPYRAGTDVIYTPDPTEAVRAEVIAHMDNAGDIKLSDEIISDSDIQSLCFRPVTHALNVEYVNPATQTPGSDIIVTLSYANAVLIPGDEPEFLLQMYHKQPLQGWKLLTPNSAPFGTNDDIGKTLTSTPDITRNELGGFIGEGEYILGFETGCGGGGGGGLVRPGLVVNLLAGVGTFAGGGGGGTAPTFGDASLLVLENPSEGLGGTISEGDDTSLESTQVVETGETVVMRFDLYENQGINNLERFRMFLNFEGKNLDTSSMDTHITYQKGGELTIVDPHEKLEKADIEILTKDPWNLVVKTTLVFKNTFATSILVDSWDLDRNSGKKLFPDALQVVESSILLADMQKDLEEQTPIIESYTIVTEEPALTYVPIWVKSNALWWNQQQIDDADFMAGIQYLIQKSIIEIENDKISETVVTQDIPVWLKEVAGHWADNSITDEEFVNAMQWLISKEIIIVQG